MQYCGPRKRVIVEQVPDYQARGWLGQRKIDGVYVELAVGSSWRASPPSSGPRMRHSFGVPQPRALGLDHRYAHNHREHGAITGGILRSGRRATAGMMGALVGLPLGCPEGTRLVGELVACTPEAFRLAQEGVAVVLFDVLAWGGEDISGAPYRARRAYLEHLVAGLEGRAAGLVRLVEQRDRGLWQWWHDVVDEAGEGLVLVDPSAPAGAAGAKLKVKREDHATVRVLSAPEGTRSILVEWGPGRTFHLTRPSWPVKAGDLIDCKAMGLTTWDLPRHCVAVRPRPDLS